MCGSLHICILLWSQTLVSIGRTNCLYHSTGVDLHSQQILLCAHLFWYAVFRPYEKILAKLQINPLYFIDVTSHERSSASNHRRLEYLSNILFIFTKETAKLCISDPLLRESICVDDGVPRKWQVTRKTFPWWRRHVLTCNSCQWQDDVIKWKHFPRY